MECRYQFLRDNKGQPIGCIAIRVTTSDEWNASIEYQVSVLNPLDTFDRSLARKIAYDRLQKRPITALMVIKGASMHTITEAVMDSIANRTFDHWHEDGVHYAVPKYLPARARKAAKLWLKTNLPRTKSPGSHSLDAAPQV